MELRPLRISKSNKLILFFAGFASDPSHYAHLDSINSVIMCYDYRNLSFDYELLESNMKDKNKLEIVAYSMGVSIASKFFKNLNANKRIAMCGTTIGIHKNYGIDPRSFHHSIKNFRIKDFKLALFGDCELEIAQNFTFRNEEILKEELSSIYKYCMDNQNPQIAWDKIYIASKDYIFTPKACRDYFTNSNNIKTIDSYHYPFFSFDSWDEICDMD